MALSYQLTREPFLILFHLNPRLPVITRFKKKLGKTRKQNIKERPKGRGIKTRLRNKRVALFFGRFFLFAN